jgi:tryptophan 2,3-dioxygenase
MTQRDIEQGIERDFSAQMSYGDYLGLDALLTAQRPLAQPPQHDEMLFIIQHQTSELWMKLMIHELEAALANVQRDALGPCFKVLARVKQIQRMLFEQWAVLETLTPSEYELLRPHLGKSSGFQSFQYRLIEFLLGNKHSAMLDVFAHQPTQHSRLLAALQAPSLYDEFLRYLARQGFPVPSEYVTRAFEQPYLKSDAVTAVFRQIYRDPQAHWQAYEFAEKLVDVEEYFQLWRFRHMKTVERIIGYKQGTGGSSGVAFLKRAVEISFFPELMDVRTTLGA